MNSTKPDFNQSTNVYDMSQPVNLAFSGSGLLFPMHIGAYRALLDKKDMISIAGVSGTSGGSIVAALIACGIGPDRMEEILYKVDLKNMIEFNFKAIFKMGYCDGNRALDALYSIFGDTKLSETSIPLYITASDVNKGEPVLLSSHTYPDMPVALAIRASMSIPFIFLPVHYDGMTLVDGMLFSSTPFTAFRNSSYPVYGIALRSFSDKSYMRKPRFFPSYALRIFELVLKGVNRMHITLSEADDDVTLYLIEADTYDVLGNYPKDDMIQFGYTKVVQDIQLQDSHV
jgi:NTE family protein